MRDRLQQLEVVRGRRTVGGPRAARRARCRTRTRRCARRAAGPPLAPATCTRPCRRRRPHACAANRRSRRCARPSSRADELREPEVRELRVAVRVDQDVAGLHVAMQHAGCVRRRERVGDAGHELGALAPASLRRSRPVLERAAVDELAHDVLPPLVLADVVHRDDVGMAQRGRGRGFLLEAPPRIVVRDRGAQELDRYGPLELRVPSHDKRCRCRRGRPARRCDSGRVACPA